MQPNSNRSAAPGVLAAQGDSAPVETARRRHPNGKLTLIGAVVLGLLLASVAVFLTFLAFNFILHFGS